VGIVDSVHHTPKEKNPEEVDVGVFFGSFYFASDKLLFLKNTQHHAAAHWQHQWRTNNKSKIFLITQPHRTRLIVFFQSIVVAALFFFLFR
jgi:hypothetical protein